MNRGLVKFLSLFITDKEKKQAFRVKYDAIERLRQRLMFERSRISGLSSGVSYFNSLRPDSNTLDYYTGLKCGEVLTKAEHEQNIKNLKANLEEESLNNLSRILNWANKAKYLRILEPKLLYTTEEYEEYKVCVDMKYEIEKKDDYFQYKNYKLPINFFYTNVFVYKNGLHTLKTLHKVPETHAIIDGGGCILDSALVFREFCPNHKIVSFEPAKPIYELGLKTIELNNLQNIRYENLALGDKNEDIKICLCTSGNIGANFIIKSHDSNAISGRSVRLDDYVKEHNLKVGLIKTDVEGFEQQLLEGAINTIKEQKPILLISIYHKYHDFYKIKPWLESLNLGYKFNFFKGIDGHPCGETLLIGEIY